MFGFFKKINLFEGQSHKARKAGRRCSIPCFLRKWLQWPQLVQAKTKNLELHPQPLGGW